MMQAAQTTIAAVVPLTTSPEVLLKEAYEAGELIRYATEQITALQERRDKIIEMLTARGIHQAGSGKAQDRSTRAAFVVY